MYQSINLLCKFTERGFNQITFFFPMPDFSICINVIVTISQFVTTIIIVTTAVVSVSVFHNFIVYHLDLVF